MRIIQTPLSAVLDSWLPPLDSSSFTALLRAIGQVGAAILGITALHSLYHGSYLVGLVHLLGASAYAWITFTGHAIPDPRRAAALTWILLIALTLTVCISEEGVRDVAVTAFPVSILIASLVLDRWQYMALTVTATLTLCALYLVEIHGLRVTVFQGHTSRRDLLDMLVVMTGTGIAARLIAETLQQGLWRTHRLAYIDSLTGLPNRRALAERLRSAGEHAPGFVADFFLAINLDRFNRINSSFGHAFGDRVLAEVGARLATFIDLDCIVGRHGGGDFLLAASSKAAPDALALAQRIQQAIRAPIYIDNAEVRIDACVGIGPANHDAVEESIEQAFIAVVAAKRRGNGSIANYSEGFGVHVRHEFWIESALRRAVDAGTVDIVYQPIVEVVGARVLACEALLRLKDAEGRNVPTLDAVQLAEATGLIHRLGWLVLQIVCRDIRAWRDMRLPSFPVSMNLSALQLSDPAFVSQFTEFLRHEHLTAQDFILEVTETAAALDSEQMHQALGALRKLGFRIAIDDFGAGYSSLGRLKLLETDIIKFDGTLVQQIDVSDQAFEFFRHAVSMALALDCVVFVEGIETEAQAARIRGTGCIGIQGFLYSLPEGAGRIAEIIGTRATAPLTFARRIVA